MGNVPKVIWELDLQMAEFIMKHVAKLPYGECAAVMATLQNQTQESLTRFQQEQMPPQPPGLRTVPTGDAAPTR